MPCNSGALPVQLVRTVTVRKEREMTRKQIIAQIEKSAKAIAEQNGMTRMATAFVQAAYNV